MSKTDIEKTIDAMIAEQGEVWLDALPDRSTERNAVIVTDNPTYCFRLMFREGQWAIVRGVLTTDEMAKFFAAFGSHWNTLLWSWVQPSEGNHVPIRAFIANGRKARSGFSISIDMARSVTVKEAGG